MFFLIRFKEHEDINLNYLININNDINIRIKFFIGLKYVLSIITDRSHNINKF